eukprot:CAMPEP_0206149404 /NCGR_PEP_ID=MMETSP1473-20131121/37761_1 /ASSEMBLY_ACC=CAM_ASM_001109 /TAXON_ID=1461547 /ORGANISM="Stichococcus sp, Strain RCC1054" /LENGTH=305 /DNA_ID=CAMNT_0053546865 /DNA_START=501 /DNA_END=1418 /DNA_ORIENTATION=-
MATPALKLNNGASMPQLGFGTWRLKGDDATDSVLNAIKLGYRHIDCATAYGNQRGVGKAFKQAFDDGLVKREDLFITSKLWNKEHNEVEEACARVLKDLQLEYLDLYLIHWPVADNEGPKVDPPISKTWERMEGLVTGGKIKAAGISNFGIQKIKDLIKKSKTKPSVLQIEIHPYWRNDELIHYAKEEGIVVTAYSPLGSEPPEGNKTPLKDEKVAEVAKKVGKSVPAVMIRWGIQRDLIVIPKATSEEHVKDNFAVLDWELSEEDMEALSSLETQNKNVPAAMFLKEGGPYVTESDLWDEGLLE